MKPIKIAVLLSFLLLVSTMNAQVQWPGQNLLKRTLKIHTDTSVIVFTIIDEELNLRPKNNLVYYWYANRKILNNTGGVGGMLLDGSYARYSTNDQLIETGNFKKGLKQGQWKLWDEQGNLLQMNFFRKGRQCGKQYIYKGDGSIEVSRFRMGKKVDSALKRKLPPKRPMNIETEEISQLGELSKADKESKNSDEIKGSDRRGGRKAKSIETNENRGSLD